jgi:hypothetical protein
MKHTHYDYKDPLSLILGGHDPAKPIQKRCSDSGEVTYSMMTKFASERLPNRLACGLLPFDEYAS